MRFFLVTLLVAVLLLAAGVDARASNKALSLKARANTASSQGVLAPADSKAPKAAATAATPANKNAEPCTKEPTQALPVKEVGVADQLPGDKEANEKLISKAEPDIKNNKAKIIKEQVLKDGRAVVDRATEVQSDVQQLQEQVLREPLIPQNIGLV